MGSFLVGPAVGGAIGTALSTTIDDSPEVAIITGVNSAIFSGGLMWLVMEHEQIINTLQEEDTQSPEFDDLN